MPGQGHGFGLRAAHYGALAAGGLPSGVDLAEALTENFLGRGGRPRAVLERVRDAVPVVLHGVGLSIGSATPLDVAYLDQLRDLVRWLEPPVVSDHLCFARVGPHHGHDLWPLPYTEEALSHVVSRVVQVQDHLGRRIALENVSSYLTYVDSGLTEWEFISEVARRADCAILLDVNNVYVSARNHDFDPALYIDAIPRGRVAQIHLAGHADKGAFLLDDHSTAVPPPVWHLYERAIGRLGPIPTIVEWDENVPSLDELAAECAKARVVESRALEAKVPETAAEPR
jgi:uncharacterized protein (UPF0276 family)